MTHKNRNFSTDEIRFHLYTRTQVRHKFTDTVNPLYSCAIATERINPFFLCCQNYASFSIALINELSNINCEIISLRPTALLEVIFYGDKRLNDKSNH